MSGGYHRSVSSCRRGGGSCASCEQHDKVQVINYSQPPRYTGQMKPTEKVKELSSGLAGCINGGGAGEPPEAHRFEKRNCPMPTAHGTQ